MSAGLLGYLGYDTVRLVERLPEPNPDPLGLPDALFLRPTVILVIDGVKGEVSVVAPAWAASGLSARAAYAQAAERVMDAVRDLDRTPSTAARDLRPAAETLAPVSNTSPEAYRAMVKRARDYIRAGDIFQVVPSQRWALPFDLPPFALYRALRRTNPSPYMFYFNFGAFQVIGASPEILVRVKEGRGTIRPIAGTRPRRDARRGRSLRGRPPRRPQGARRAPDASRPRPQRRRPRRPRRHGDADRAVRHRALLPRHAHRLQCRGRPFPRPRRPLRPPRGPARRHGLGRAQGGRTLFTSEVAEEGRGVIGLWNAAAGYRRIPRDPTGS
jgi:hypothetical protein